MACELCEAARFTEWFHEDDECWIAECEACSTPMVVWKVHSPTPPDEVRAALHAKLSAVMERTFDEEFYIDDNMRQIPDHYHAHARVRGRWFGSGLRRKA